MSDLTIEGANYGGDQMPWAEYVAAGKIIFLSGSEGRDMSKKQEYPDGEPDESPVYEGVEAQTRASLQKIAERVVKAGTSLDNIAVINYYVPNRSDWPAVWQTCEAFWAEHCPDMNERPRAGTLLTEVGLDRPDMLIEIEAIAYKP
ncbi:MAG: RidA family protein [Solirubrobacterales bacterium]